MNLTNNEPLVSVLIPYYKGSKYIEEALLSVINQTYKNIEIIVINDSPDDIKETEYIINLQKKYNFQLIHHEFNLGLTKSLVTAFKHSSGKYISIFAQDDLFKPEKTVKQLNIFKENPDLVVVYSNMEFWNMDTNQRTTPDISETLDVIKNKSAFPKLYCYNAFNGLYGQASLIKREVVEKDIVPLWTKFFEDVWPIKIMFFEKYPDKIYLINDADVIYRNHSTQSVNTMKLKIAGFCLQVIDEMCPKEFKEQGTNWVLSTFLGIKIKRYKRYTKLLKFFIPFSVISLLINILLLYVLNKYI